jgi:hypothetical protein
LAASKPVTTLLVCHDTGLGTFTHQLDRILPVAVPQSGLAPPYTQRRLGSGRLTMYVYANLSGLELPDRAQRRCEDHCICRWHGPPSRSSQPVALGSSVPWSFSLSLSLDLRAALPSGTITATATYRAATGERSVQRQWPRLLQRPTLGNGCLSSLRPIDLALASDGGCFWVFHLEPLIRAASTVRRAKPLGHDAFAPECAGVLVDHRAVAVIGRVERDAVCVPRQGLTASPHHRVQEDRRRIRLPRDRAGDTGASRKSIGRSDPPRWPRRR